MATVILNHKVKDYATWRPLFESDKARREVAGLKEIVVGEKEGEPGNVFAIFDVPDASIINKMMSDPELQARMQEGGVIGKPEITVIN